MGQAGIILRRIHTLCQDHSIKPMAIFCGDFNSTPSSGSCEFIKQGKMDCYLANRQTLSGQLESRESGWPPRGGKRVSDVGRVKDLKCQISLMPLSPGSIFLFSSLLHDL
jgi:hypothetical protein